MGHYARRALTAEIPPRARTLTSWRQADADKGIPLLYRLKEGERWTLLDRDRAMVVHPERQPKIVYPDGRVEEIPSNTEA
jgi:hypothetical protein